MFYNIMIKILLCLFLRCIQVQKYYDVFKFKVWFELLRACVVQGPVDDRFLVWWVIDNIVWTDSWLSISCAGHNLIGAGADEEQAWKTRFGNGHRLTLVTGNAPVTDQVLQISQER
jgi:hypothetical protein